MHRWLVVQVLDSAPGAFKGGDDPASVLLDGPGVRHGRMPFWLLAPVPAGKGQQGRPPPGTPRPPPEGRAPCARLPPSTLTAGWHAHGVGPGRVAGAREGLGDDLPGWALLPRGRRLTGRRRGTGLPSGPAAGPRLRAVRRRLRGRPGRPRPAPASRADLARRLLQRPGPGTGRVPALPDSLRGCLRLNAAPH
jgi:hypothetical protein